PAQVCARRCTPADDDPRAASVPRRGERRRYGPVVGADELDFTERPRPPDGWSLRAALTRYAQGQPERVAALLQVVRRIQFGIAKGATNLQPCIERVDVVADALAVWAADPWRAHRPDAEVDAAVVSLTAELDALGVPVEERPTRPSRR